MEFAKVLREKRKKLNLTQQGLADQLHVTRQTLSRWENNSSFPNLDTLTELSDLLAIPLDNLLKGDDNTMVKKISSDVRDKRRFKRYLITIGIIASLLVLWLGLLGFGRAKQIIWIDRSNPFLPTEYGYAILPTMKEANALGTEKKNIKVKYQGDNKPTKKKVKLIDIHVQDDPIGRGSWLKLPYVVGWANNDRWVVVEHKGSFIKGFRMINQHEIPISMRFVPENQYQAYDSFNDQKLTKTASFSWWPFN